MKLSSKINRGLINAENKLKNITDEINPLFTVSFPFFISQKMKNVHCQKILLKRKKESCKLAFITKAEFIDV
jgi:hypothetical protein